MRNYSGSKVQIKDYPIEYVKTTKQGNTYDCGMYALEYLAKWEGRKVPTLNKEIVTELRKIYLWNWVTNTDFNKREGAKAWMEDDVKAYQEIPVNARNNEDFYFSSILTFFVSDECKVLAPYFPFLWFLFIIVLLYPYRTMFVS